MYKMVSHQKHAMLIKYYVAIVISFQNAYKNRKVSTVRCIQNKNQSKYVIYFEVM
jgi:hypothetical protein